MTILIGLALLSILILIHEFGHFWAARICGVKVEEFGLGLPPKALQIFRDKKKTAFTLNWLPFGGFVRMKGEDGLGKKMLHEPDSFVAQPVGKRMFIVTAGVIFNFVTGALFLCLSYIFGSQVLLENSETAKQEFFANNPKAAIVSDQRIGFPIIELAADSPLALGGVKRFDFITQVDQQDFQDLAEFQQIIAAKSGEKVQLTVWRRTQSLVKEILVNEQGEIGLITGIYLRDVVPDSLAAKAGILPGDILVKINGQKLLAAAALQASLAAAKNQSVTLDLLRQGETLTKEVQVDATGKIGVVLEVNLIQKIYQRIYFRLPILVALAKTPGHILELTGLIFQGISRIFGSLLTGKGLPDGVGGPVAIVQETFYRANSFTALLTFAALLSLTLALFNILPFPALDGGQLCFLLYEAVTRRRLNPKLTNRINAVGYLLLLALIAFVTWQDIFG